MKLNENNCIIFSFQQVEIKIYQMTTIPTGRIFRLQLKLTMSIPKSWLQIN